MPKKRSGSCPFKRFKPYPSPFSSSIEEEEGEEEEDDEEEEEEEA